jgi:hypothetical protein
MLESQLTSCAGAVSGAMCWHFADRMLAYVLVRLFGDFTGAFAGLRWRQR